MDIDFVVVMVDDSDPFWRAEYEKSKPEKDKHKTASCRFRDWGWMRYWFRAVELYAPWVRTVWLVVAYESQVPEWLDRENPKLKVVLHEDYIPKEYLPTFNSHTIELNLHRIEGLAEHFVYFNDDMFLNAPISPEYYFRDGLPCDCTNEHPFASPCLTDNSKWGINIIEYCNAGVINKHFSRKNVIRQSRKRWFGTYLGLKYMAEACIASLRPLFGGFDTPHFEKPLLKSVFGEVWEAEPEYLSESCTRFRDDLNVSIYLMREWQLASNKFSPVRLRGKREIKISNTNIGYIEQVLNDKKITSYCLNDSWRITDENFIRTKNEILELMHSKYSQKSSFEK